MATHWARYRALWQGQRRAQGNALAEIAIFRHEEAKFRAIDDGMLIALIAGAGGRTMLRLGERQRTVLIETFPEVGNLGVATMVFGQLLLQEPFSVGLALAGAAMWVALIGMTLVLAGERR